MSASSSAYTELEFELLQLSVVSEVAPAVPTTAAAASTSAAASASASVSEAAVDSLPAFGVIRDSSDLKKAKDAGTSKAKAAAGKPKKAAQQQQGAAWASGVGYGGPEGPATSTYKADAEQAQKRKDMQLLQSVKRITELLRADIQVRNHLGFDS